MNYFVLSAIIALIVCLNQSSAEITSNDDISSNVIDESSTAATTSEDETNETVITDSLDSTTENGTDGECKVHPLVVPLHHIWKYILHPHSANIGYCSGSCLRSKSTYYSYRESINRRISIPMSEPCCTPTEFKPLHVVARLYNSESGRYSKSILTLEDLVIMKCGCQ